MNHQSPGDIGNDDVEAALARIASRDPERAAEAAHIVDALTWGEGMDRVSQESIQTWLWYELTTKYLVDEAGFAARIAGIAAELFDELGLDRYAAVCRSEMTAQVHAAFERSSEEGFAVFGRARDESGIDPPDTRSFAWGGVMGMEEASARSQVAHVLEIALAEGDFAVGGRGWRAKQRGITDSVLDSDHPGLPGQSWRTAILTERIGRWIAEAERRSPTLGALRAGAAKELLSPTDVPRDVATLVAPLTWLLNEIGESQKLTQAGYLNTAFVRRVVETCPWEEQGRSVGAARTESDAPVLSALRLLAVRIGALRKRRGVLERTKAGAAMVSGPDLVWEAIAGRGLPGGWEGFAFTAVGLGLLGERAPIAPDRLWRKAADAAGEMGWTSDDGYGDIGPPNSGDVNFSIFDEQIMFSALGLLKIHGDWRNRMWQLTEAGRVMLRAMLAGEASGPRERP